MKKILLVLLAVMTVSSLSAQTLWSESFSNGIPSTWTMFNDNNTAHNQTQTQAWSVTSELGNPAPAVVSASWFDPAGVADRWLITDAFTVPESGYAFSLEAACFEAAYPDGFAVKVSTTNRDSRDAFTTTIISVAQATDQLTEYRGSLDAFVGQTIYIAVIQNSNDMNFLIADNFKVFKPTENEIELLSVNVPNYISGGTSTNVSGVVKNNGNQPLTSFDVTYSVNGGANVAVYTVSGINVPFGGTYEFTHNVPFMETTSGRYTIQMTVSNPNNVQDPTPDNNVASASTVVYDPSAAVERTTILEQFTGAACGYCPAGHDRIEQALEGTNVIWAVHHAGFGNDGLTCNANNAYTFFYNAGSTYAPAMMVDRFHGAADEPGPVTSVYDVSGIVNYVNTVNQVPCFLSLNVDGITYNAQNRTLGGTVTGHFTSEIYGANTRLTLMIVEDSNIMAQTDYSTGSSTTISNYMHMNAVRGTVTDTWGDPITVNANGDFTYNVNYTLPSNLKAWRCRIIAIVSDRNSSDANACSVMQAAQTSNLNAPYVVGINDVANANINLYPNPTTGKVTIEAENFENAVVLDMTGRQVMTTTSNVIDMSNLTNGVYMVRITTTTGTTTQKVVKK